jgi:hypothetical protein|nr:MAG TPA: hypothetical protein [Caudoviricetes sp.]
MGTDPQIELAAVKEQLKSIKESVDDIKTAVTKLIAMEKLVTEVKVRQVGHEEKIADCTKRIEALELRQTNNTAYLNKLRGGIGLTATLVTLIQAVVLAGASWLLTSVIDAREDISVLDQNIKQLEHDHDRLIQGLISKGKVDRR